MKETGFSEEQMVKSLHEADATPVARVAKKHGISDQASLIRAARHWPNVPLAPESQR